MALPLSISGISTAVACVGPYKSSGGNYYFFGRDNTTATTLQAYKSTAPDTSWASIATRTGFTTAVLVISGYQVADVIHLLVMDGTMSTSVATKYVSFNMATDTYLASTETVAAASVITGLATAGWGCSLVVRSTGEVVAFYNGVNTKTTNTYSRLYYQRRTGVNTWSAAVQVDTNVAKDSVSPAAVLSSSDVVHFLNVSNTAGFVGVHQRTLSAANVLQTASAVAPFSLVQQTTSVTPAVSFNNAGTQKIVAVVKAGGTSSTFSAVRFDSGNTPTLSSSTIATNLNTAGPIAAFNDGTNVYAVYRNSSDLDLYSVKSTDNGATWGTAAAIYVGTSGSTAESLSRSGNVYQRGSSIVFPYVGILESLLKYNETVVRTVATHYTMPADTGTFALSGKDAALTKAAATVSYTMPAATGAFTLNGTGGWEQALWGQARWGQATGATAALRVARRLPTTVGAFTLAGKTAALAYGRRPAAATGLFTLTLRPANLVYGSAKVMPAAMGTFALAGQAATLRYSRIMPAVKGTFTLAGQAAILRYGRVAIAAKGTFTLNGITAALKPARALPIASGAFVLSGKTATLRYARMMGATTATFVLGGSPVNLVYSGSGDKTMPAATGTVALSGKPTTLRYSRTFPSVKGTFVLTGVPANLVYTPSITHDITLTAAPGVFLLGAEEAELDIERFMPPLPPPGRLNFGRRIYAIPNRW